MRILSVFFLSVSLLFGQTSPIEVIPTPRDVTYFDATFRISQTTRLVVPVAESPTSRLLNEHLSKSAGFTLKTTTPDKVDRWADIIYLDILQGTAKAREFSRQLNIATIIELAEEGYFLQSTDSSIVILANASHGLFNGVMTLLQIIKQQGDRYEVPGLTIIDWPILSMRGIGLDLRHRSVPNLDRLKETLRTMGRYKLNTCLLDIGPLFQFKAHPKIGDGRGVLSAKEIEELESVAQAYHVQLIPAIATLMGFDRVLALPEYGHLAAFPGSGSLDIGTEETYEFLRDLVGEISQAFSSPWIGIGYISAVESVDRVEDQSEILIRHNRRVFDMLRDNAKRAIIETPQRGVVATAVPDSVLFWMPGPPPFGFNHDFLIQVPVTIGSGMLPDFFAGAGEMERRVFAGLDNGAVGVVVEYKTNEVSPYFFEFSRPGFPLAAQLSWSGESITMKKLDGLVKNVFSHFDDSLLLLSLLDGLYDHDFWLDMWRHPLLMGDREVLPEVRKRANHLWNDMTQALKLLNTARANDSRNHVLLDYYRYAAEHGLWLARKLDAVRQLWEFRVGLKENPFQDGAGELMDLCLNISADLNLLMEQFQILWLRSNRSEDAGVFLDLYSTQISYWREIARLIELGRLQESPVLENDWIRHPSDGSVQASHAFFRKTFDLRAGFKSATLQVIANGHAKVYLNGAFLDEVVFPGKFGRSQMWELGSSGLVPGKNVIAIEAWNDRGQPAGVHVYGEVEYEFGRKEIIESNRYWKTTVKAENDWPRLGFFDVQWLNTVKYENDLKIIKPNLELRRPGQFAF